MANYTVNRLEYESIYYSLVVDKIKFRIDFTDSSLFYINRSSFKTTLTKKSEFHPYTEPTISSYDYELTTFEGDVIQSINTTCNLTLLDGSVITINSNSGVVDITTDNIHQFSGIESVKTNNYKVITQLVQDWEDQNYNPLETSVSRVIKDTSPFEAPDFVMKMSSIKRYTLGGALYEDYVNNDGIRILSTSRESNFLTLGDIFYDGT